MSKMFFKSLPPLPEPPRIAPTVKATECGLQYGRPVKLYVLPDTPVGLQAFLTARRECMEQIHVLGRLRAEHLEATKPKPRKLTSQNLMILEKAFPSERTFANYNRNRSGSESSFYSNRATRGMCPETLEGMRSLPVTSERIAVATACVAGLDRTINVSLTSSPAAVGRQPRVKRHGRSKAVAAEPSAAVTPSVASSDHIKEASNSSRATGVRLPESTNQSRSAAPTAERSAATKSCLTPPHRSQQPTRAAVGRRRESRPDSNSMLYDKLESGEFGAHSPEFPWRIQADVEQQQSP